MALNLTLHCGAHEVPFSKIQDSQAPAATDTFYPVEHATLVDHVRRELDAANLNVVGEAHAMTAAGNRYFGLMEVSDDSNGGDYATVIGIRNSHDKMFSAGLAVGSGVFVCDNLAFSGEITIARRHTRFIERDLAGLVGRCMGAIGSMRVNMEERIAAYKETELSDARFNDLLVRAVEQGCVPVTQAMKVLKEWRAPRHQEFKDAGPTSWRAFNAFTQILGDKPNVSQLATRTTKLHGLVDGASGITFGANGKAKRAPLAITFETAV